VQQSTRQGNLPLIDWLTIIWPVTIWILQVDQCTNWQCPSRWWEAVKKMLHLRHLKLAMNTSWQYIDVCEGIRVIMIIKGQYINNSSFVKPTLNLHTYKIQFLMLVYTVIFPNTTSTQNESVQIHAYTKDVWYMCLLGHIVKISLHIYGVEFIMWSNYYAPSTS
jgi:hypothetical protein